MSQLTQGQKKRLMYIERKSGHADDGPARIGWVTFSKSGRTIRYSDKEFRSMKGAGVSGNYIEMDSGDEYWISGVKKTGSNRHVFGRGGIEIDGDAVEAYEELRGTK